MCAALYGGLSASAFAQDSPDRVTTAFEEGNPFDVNVGIDYDFKYHSSSIRREWIHKSRRTLARDLVYRQLRHSIVPSIEVGLFRGLAFYAKLPVVVSDQRDYRFDRNSRKACVDPGQANAETPATCVDKTNSSTLRDGIVPLGGFSASRKGGPFLAYPSADTRTIFRGPNRHGIDQLHLGLKYAVIRQDKQNYFPTWLVAFESRVGIGQEQRMSKTIVAPSSNSFVGRKVHEFGLWTSVHRRFRFIEPHATAYARWAVASKDSAIGRINSPGTPSPGPQNHLGVSVGALIIPWVQPAKNLRFALDLRANLDYVGRGYAYSPAWELLADSPALVASKDPSASRCSVTSALQFATLNPANPSDYLRAANAGTAGGNCVAYSGVTRVDAYASMGGSLSFRLQLGPWAELSLGTTLYGTTQHMISGDSMGIPGVSGNPNLVELDSLDINAHRRDVIDRPGRRYAADDIFTARAHARLRLTF